MDGKQLLNKIKYLVKSSKEKNRLRDLIYHLAIKGLLTQRLTSDLKVKSLSEEILQSKERYFVDNKLKTGRRNHTELRQEKLEVPDEWGIIPIGDLVHLVNGRAFKSSEWVSAGIPIIRIQNLRNPNKKYNFFDGALDDKHRVKTGDMLLSWSGTPGTSFGAFIWDGPEGALNQHIFKVNMFSEHTNKEYLKFAVNALLEPLISNARGGVGIKHVTKSVLLRIPLSKL